MQVFSYKFYEIFANKYLIEYLRATASKFSNQKVSLHIITNPCKWHQLRQYVLTTLSTLKMDFACRDNFGNHHPEQVLRGNIFGGVSL